MGGSNGKSRPMSASSRKKAELPVKKTGRGLGYFGDDSDKIRDAQMRTL